MRNPLGGHPPWRQLVIIAVVLPLEREHAAPDRENAANEKVPTETVG